MAKFDANGSATVLALPGLNSPYGIAVVPAPVVKVSAVCHPPSGSAFPVGTTPVACSATDRAGNVSSCGFNVTVRPNNTPAGTGVRVPPHFQGTGTAPSLEVTFDKVITSGTTTVTGLSQAPPPPGGYRVTAQSILYDITTTALFIGPVEVCFLYDEAQVSNEANLRLFHFEAGRWVDVTVLPVDTVRNIICGRVSSLSPFAVFERVSFLPPDCNPMVSVLEQSRVHFHDGGQQYAEFKGSVILPGGLLPEDLRDSATVAHGRLNVRLANKGWYANEHLTFQVKDTDPNENKEQWEFKASGKERVLIHWKNHVSYQAKLDPTVNPNTFGTLSSQFIHSDRTALRWNFERVARPATLKRNGLLLVRIAANGTLTAGPGVTLDRSGKKVDLEFADRLVPGDTFEWVTATASHTQIIGSGTATEVYFSAGGKVEIRVPQNSQESIGANSLPRTATVELQVGDTTVACVVFGVTADHPYVVDSEEHWKFHDDDED